MPQISVIVPVFKVEPYLHRCVDSILGQTFTDFELILVDDGSPDNCPAICDEYAQKDSRVIVIHQGNGGLSAARNTGIDWTFANSDSQWLTFIDSDDWVHECYLQIMMNAAIQNSVPIVACNFLATNDLNGTVKKIEGITACVDTEWAYSEKYGMCMTACCKLYSKELFANLRFPVGKLHEDAFITHLLLFSVSRIALCDDMLYNYFTNVESITRSPWTPRRLDEIDAHAMRLDYLQKKGYLKAHRREILASVLALVSQMDMIDRTTDDYGDYRKYLSRKLKQMLLRYAIVADIKIKENYHIYEVAFPVFMKAYWYLLAAMRKLRKR